MTTQTEAPVSGGPGFEVRDSVYLSRAKDGDVLVIFEGSGLAHGSPVEIVLDDGRLRVQQSGRIAVDLVLDDLGRDTIQRAPKLFVEEVYFGQTEDDHVFVFHDETTLVDRMGPGNEHERH